MNLNEYNVLKVLNNSKQGVFFRELSKMSGVSIGGTQQVLKNYSGFVDKVIKGRNTYYFLKKDVRTFYLRKIIELMISQNFLSINPLFSDFFGYFIKKDIPCLVFGGYAKGRFTKNSDVDLLVLSSAKIPEYLCPVEVHAITLSKSQIETAVRKKETLIKEIINNRIIINGVDYFMRWLNEKD